MKKSFWSRIAALGMVAVLMFGLVACGSGKPSNDSSNDNTTDTGKTDDTVVDLGGYEFVVASPFIQDSPDMETVMGSERSFEEARQKVEKAYNCKIKVTNLWPSMENLRAKTMTGDKYADIIHIPMNFQLQAIRAGYIQDLNSVKGLYPDDYRWVKACTEMATYDKGVYGLNFMRPSEVRTCLVYNRDVLKKCGITENMEQLVRDKQWTFDKFEELLKKATKDTNGDGKTDIFGMMPAIWNELGFAMINSNGGSLVKVENGVAKENFSSQEAITALNYLSKWINEDKTVANVYGADARLGITTQAYANYFVNGECAFMFCESWLITQQIKPIANNVDYGILPLPMGPNATDYVSNANNALVFAIPSTNTKDVDKTVIVMNALAKEVAGAENDSDAQAAYDYDIMMDYFGKEDADAAEMYNLILSKSYVDRGAAVDSLLADFGSEVVVDACCRQFGTPAAAIESISGMYDDQINSIYNK